MRLWTWRYSYIYDIIIEELIINDYHHFLGFQFLDGVLVTVFRAFQRATCYREYLLGLLRDQVAFTLPEVLTSARYEVLIKSTYVPHGFPRDAYVVLPGPWFS